MVKRVNYRLEYIVGQEPNNIKSIDILNEAKSGMSPIN